MESKIITDTRIWGYLILTSFFLFLPIDALTGLLSTIGINVSVSAIWKFLLFFCISIYLFRYSKGQIIWFSIILYASIIILINSFKPFEDLDELPLTLNHLFRFLFCVFVYAFINFQSYRLCIYGKLKKIISFSNIFLIANILLIIFGVGTRTYSDSFSSKGFFYAGNEVSGLFILLGPLYLYWISLKCKATSLKFWLTFILTSAATILLGSKTAIIGTLFLNIIVIKGFLRKNGKIKLFYVIMSLLLLLILFYGIEIVAKWDLWQRWTFFYEKGGFNKVIFSDRDAYWAEEKHDILNGEWYDLLFGLGGNRTVEMDIFFSFLNYGIIGLLMVYSFYYYIIYRVYKLRRRVEIAQIVFAIDIAFLIFSSVAGHMVYSGMGAPFMAIINMLPIIYQKEKLLLDK